MRRKFLFLQSCHCLWWLFVWERVCYNTFYIFCMFFFTESTLGNLKTMANDHSIFWFGSEFKSICSVSRPPLLCQWNFHPKKKDSIFSRLNIEVNVSTIDRLMGIQYNYEAGMWSNTILLITYADTRWGCPLTN